jgi:anaerobic magnesium-protoporphyrin IX monomethyl ester cyclase
VIDQSYYLRFDAKLLAANQPYPPLGTLYAASYMRSRGYQVALFDAMLAESEWEWDAALHRNQPYFAVIFEDNFNYLSKMCLARMREAAMLMIDMARKRGCVVILCGADASDHR